MTKYKTGLKTSALLKQAGAVRVMLLLVLVLPVVASERAGAGTIPGESGKETGSATLPTPATMLVLGDGSAPTPNTPANPPTDPNEVIGGILSNETPKFGTSTLVNELTKAGFAQEDALSVNDTGQTVLTKQMTDFIWLAALAVCFGLITIVFRRIRARNSSPKSPVRSAAELDHPRPI
jgi:hypothetical protein